MRWLLSMTVLCTLLVAPLAEAQNERAVVLVVDAGSSRLSQDQLTRALQAALRRRVLRMTDEDAQQAEGRLTIAFSPPNRWVLRYEALGQVAWLSDRIVRGSLRDRLTELSQHLVSRVESTGGGSAAATAERRRAWNDDLIVALANEIVDPFAGDAPRPQPRPISVLWSEVIDPFGDQPPRARVSEVWSEVLDPWAAEIRRRR
jgi:hypothetical protein